MNIKGLKILFKFLFKIYKVYKGFWFTIQIIRSQQTVNFKKFHASVHWSYSAYIFYVYMNIYVRIYVHVYIDRYVVT